MGHIFQILGRFNICLSNIGFPLPLETWIDDILHGADALTLNFSGDFAIQEAIGHFIYQLVIILFIFSYASEDKNVEKMLWDILFCYFFL